MLESKLTSNGAPLLEPHEGKELPLANALIDSKYQFSVVQQRIISQIFAYAEQIEGHDYFRLHVKNLGFPEGSRNIYTRLKEEIPELLKKTLRIPVGDTHLFIAPISSAIYISSSAEVEFGIDKKILPFIKELKKDFTLVDMQFFLTLRSRYAQRIYLQLARFKSTGWWYVSVKNLKQQLGLSKSYDHYYNIKNKVLNIAEKALKDSPYEFEIETHKKAGEKEIQALTFRLVKLSQIDTQEQKELLNRLIKEFKIQEPQARQIVMRVPTKEIRATFNKIQKSHLKKPIDNKGAYSWKLFKNNFNL